MARYRTGHSPDKETDSPLEELEIDQNKPFSIMDSSRPLLIDRSSRNTGSSLITYVFLHFFLILLISFSVPKGHSIDEAIFYHTKTTLNVTFDYHFSFSGFSSDFGQILLSLCIIRPVSLTRSLDRVTFTASAYRTAFHSAPTIEFSDPFDIDFLFFTTTLFKFLS
jgi:hypothetical protein